MTTGLEGMSQTEQMLHTLDDFTVCGGINIKYMSTDSWRMTLGKETETRKFAIWVHLRNGNYGYGKTPSEASQMAAGEFCTAERALEGGMALLRAQDAARRLAGSVSRPSPSTYRDWDEADDGGW